MLEGVKGKEERGQKSGGAWVSFGSLLPLDLPLVWLPAKLVGIRNSIMKKSFMGKGGFNLGLRGIYIYI